MKSTRLLVIIGLLGGDDTIDIFDALAIVDYINSELVAYGPFVGMICEDI